MAGRPTSYTEAIGAEICRRLGEGESLLRMCKDDHLPHRVTILRWLTDEIGDDDPRQSFRSNYPRARMIQADYMFEDVLEIARGAAADAGSDVQRDKLQVDTTKWVLARMDARKYGDHTQTTLRGDPEAPLQAEVTHKIPMTPEQEALMGEFVEDFVRAGDEE